MIKLIAKCVLAATVAIAAVSVSTSSFAAAKKAAAPPPPAKCTLHTTQKSCNAGVCAISWCGYDGKWYPTPFMCWEPFCGPK